MKRVTTTGLLGYVIKTSDTLGIFVGPGLCGSAKVWDNLGDAKRALTTGLRNMNDRRGPNRDPVTKDHYRIFEAIITLGKDVTPT